MMIRRLAGVVVVAGAVCAAGAWGQSAVAKPGGRGSDGYVMPKLPPMPRVEKTKPNDSVTMQDPKTFAKVTLDFPITKGPFAPTWESISEEYRKAEGGGAPAWLREAKFGIWVHFGPQSQGQSGDWYARKIYQPGQVAYANHIRDFGHPSETGYKDVLHAWTAKELKPAELVKLYSDAGARFLIVQGVHHDNFDNWNSMYQPWNAVNIGPKRDLVGEWSKATHAVGMRFGVAFHHEYTWWWWQPAFGADTEGPKAGVPYDAAKLTLADGKGTWWQGYDPALLYGVNLREYKDVANAKYRPEEGIFQDHQEYAKWYATRWALRIMDVVHHYDPDFIYTDGDSTGPFDGYKTGTGTKNDAMERVIADFYNHALAERGQVDVFSIVKFHPPAKGIVSTVESRYPKEIKRDQDWIGENAAGDWFYKPEIVYSSAALERYLLEEVSRDGSYAVNIPMRPDGSIDEGARTMLREMGAWMRVNGQGIYGSKAWVKFGEGPLDADGKMHLLPTGALNKPQAEYQFAPGDWRFTQGKDGAVYAWAMWGPKAGEKVRVESLGTKAGPMRVHRVAVLGAPGKVSWAQEADALVFAMPPGTKGDVVGVRVE